MQKTFIYLILTLLTLTGFSQNKTKMLQDTLIWSSDYELSKSDFQAKAKKGYAGMALTFIYLYTKEENGDIVFVVEAVLSKSKSFLSGDSDYEFKHEKGHFDLCEVYARKLRQKIIKKNFLKVKNIRKEITDMYKQINEDLKDEQEKYDTQTEHSMNMAQQKKWIDKIATELKELDEYSDTIVSVVNK